MSLIDNLVFGDAYSLRPLVSLHLNVVVFAELGSLYYFHRTPFFPYKWS